MNGKTMKKLFLALMGSLMGLLPITGNAVSFSSKTMAYTYPGQPGCGAMGEIADGRKIDAILAQFFIVSPAGSLTLMTTSTYGCDGFDPSVLAQMRQHSGSQYVTVAAGASATAALTASPSSSIQSLVSFASENGMAGVDVDFEGYSQWSAATLANYMAFLSSLASALHAEGMQLMVNLPAMGGQYSDLKPSLYHGLSYAAVAAIADYANVMAYDYQYDYGAGNPVAPVPWVNAVIAYAKAQVPIAKLVVSMPSYGYHGTTGKYDIGGFDTQQQSLALKGSINPTRDASYELHFTKGRTSYVYQDAYGMTQKRLAIESAGIQTVAIFTLGGNPWFQ